MNIVKFDVKRKSIASSSNDYSEFLAFFVVVVLRSDVEVPIKVEHNKGKEIVKEKKSYGRS